MGFMLKYRGPILPVTSTALGSNDLNLDQSGTSMQILPEPDIHPLFHYLYELVQEIQEVPSWADLIRVLEKQI